METRLKLSCRGTRLSLKKNFGILESPRVPLDVVDIIE